MRPTVLGEFLSTPSRSGSPGHLQPAALDPTPRPPPLMQRPRARPPVHHPGLPTVDGDVVQRRCRSPSLEALHSGFTKAGVIDRQSPSPLRRRSSSMHDPTPSATCWPSWTVPSTRLRLRQAAGRPAEVHADLTTVVEEPGSRDCAQGGQRRIGVPTRAGHARGGRRVGFHRRLEPGPRILLGLGCAALFITLWRALARPTGRPPARHAMAENKSATVIPAHTHGLAGRFSSIPLVTIWARQAPLRPGCCLTPGVTGTTIGERALKDVPGWWQSRRYVGRSKRTSSA